MWFWPVTGMSLRPRLLWLSPSLVLIIHRSRTADSAAVAATSCDRWHLHLRRKNAVLTYIFSLCWCEIIAYRLLARSLVLRSSTNLGLIHGRCPQRAFPSVSSLSYLVNHSLHHQSEPSRARSLLLGDLISNYFSRPSSKREGDQVSHPYETEPSEPKCSKPSCS
jgi:hypothetical protein